MLSYQHYYHAGNHADILKHVCWLSIVNYLNQKPKPYTLIDSHAGEGIYPYHDDRNRERGTGIERLLGKNTNNEVLKLYLAAVECFAIENQFPGSPAIASHLMRPDDCLHLIERHPAAITELARWVKSVSRNNIHIHKRDGFEGVVGLTPPKIKRGAILIDPPYEQSDEYNWSFNTIKKAQKNWAQASIVIWYPLLGLRATEKASACKIMLSKLKTFSHQVGQTFNQFELCYTTPEQQPGMYGSGVFVINPPWTLKQTMEDSLSVITCQLGKLASWRSDS